MGLNNKYLGVRPYIEAPLLISEEASNLQVPKNMKDYMLVQATESKLSKWSFYRFDIGTENASYGNILNDFVSWKYAHPEFFTNIKMGRHQAAIMEYKPKLIAQSLYGDPALFYTIMIFNDIYHDAELSKDRLQEQGIIVLNEVGINALKDIMVFKRKYEYNEEEPFAPSDF